MTNKQTRKDPDLLLLKALAKRKQLNLPELELMLALCKRLILKGLVELNYDEKTGKVNISVFGGD